MFHYLDRSLSFPHPSQADPDGLLAVGGDLSTGRLLLAYSHGIFPWFTDDTPILWYAPPERCVLYPEKLKLSKSMRQWMRNTKLTVAVDRDFAGVIEHCADSPRKDQDGTWITEDMLEAYIELHELGYAHSVEVYDEQNELVGGLYGVQVGKIFCGESMFSKVPNASKLALATLCQKFDFELIDCQVYSDHLGTLGAEIISGADFYELLQKQS